MSSVPKLQVQQGGFTGESGLQRRAPGMGWAMRCVFVCLILFLVGAAGCASAPAGKGGDRAEVYERYRVQFAAAHFTKPAEWSSTNGLAFTLAPLFLQEASADLKAAAANGPQLVYFGTDAVHVGGRIHARYMYIWQIPNGDRDGATSRSFQGVRITLDSEGLPVIWEVLRDRSGAELVFVAQSLETAAKAQYGAVLPGRRHVVEQGTNQAAQVVVARVLDDGPVAMGPMVYLEPRTHSMATLICRCMPAQAKTLVGSQTYQVEGVSEAAAEFGRVFGVDEVGSARIERVLRLPGEF